MLDEHGAVTFFDVDGTLVWSDDDPTAYEDEAAAFADYFANERPSEGVADAFSRMSERGHATFICTGRPYYMITPGLRALNPTGVICGAGSYVRVGDTVVHEEHIPADAVMETARLFVEAGIDVDVESNERLVGLYPTGGVCPYPGSLTVRSLDEFAAEAPKLNVNKFSTHSVPAERIARIMPYLTEHFTVSDMQFGVYEVALKGLDKGAAIGTVLDYLGRSRAQTFAFGDSENDLPMAGAVETFVAMGNALPHVKDTADYVTDHVRDDGIVSALAHFGLI